LYDFSSTTTDCGMKAGQGKEVEWRQDGNTAEEIQA
jgi:hypothetical protein